jgi:hypothetical protein
MTASNLKRYGWIVLTVAGVVGANYAADVSAAAPAPGFWPDLNWATTCWFAVLAILALTLRLKPLLSIRNLDALVLAAMCLLLALRDAPGGPVGSAHPWQSWAYLGLTGSVVYWVLRALVLVAARRPLQSTGTISGSVRLVLLAAGLALCIHKLATAPLTSASRDGIVGGLCTSATGKLPYGDTPGFDGRSPLLYLVHAGAVRLVPPTLVAEGQAFAAPLTWQNRDWWLAQPWLATADLRAARLVNAALFILILLGLFLIGLRLQTEGAAWIIVALFCLFAGTLEGLPQPDIMLPTLLLTWTIAFALLPGVGGLLAVLGIVLAGVAWPWAWLGLPLLLAYFWRRGWQAVGSTVGLLGGVAACIFGLAWLVQPAIPRDNGALALAGLQPLYDARLANADTLVIDQRDVTTQEVASPAATARLWRFLIDRESATLKEAADDLGAVKIDWPNGVNGSSVFYRQVQATPAALPLLQTAYRKVVGQMPDPTRLLVAARTVIESTWQPARPEAPPVTEVWRLWGGPPPLTGRWLLLRRAAKLAVAVLVIWATLAIFLGRRARPRNLLGALLLTSCGGLLASEVGAVTYLVWLLPPLVALWAVHEADERPAAFVPHAGTIPHMTPLDPQLPPRITIESPPPPRP